MDNLPWGFVLFRDISLPNPLNSELPILAYGPPSAFFTSSTVCSSACLEGLFHPSTAYEIHSSGVFPSNQSDWLIA